VNEGPPWRVADAAVHELHRIPHPTRLLYVGIHSESGVACVFEILGHGTWGEHARVREVGSGMGMEPAVFEQCSRWLSERAERAAVGDGSANEC